MLPLTPALLKSCMPRAEMAKCEAWADPLNDAMDAYGMNTIERQAGLLGSVANETGSLHATKEVSYYSTDYDYCRAKVFGQRMPLREVWEGWRAEGREAFYVKSFDWLYDDRKWPFLGLGNTQDHDGSNYVGRGVGITGRYLYDKCGRGIGVDLVNNPDKLLEPVPAAFTIAYLWQDVGNNERMDRGDAYGAFKTLNPGGNGEFFNPHMAYYRHIRGVLVQASLLAAGFDPMGVDGIMGNHTLAALHAFRAARNLPDDAAAVAALARAA